MLKKTQAALVITAAATTLAACGTIGTTTSAPSTLTGAASMAASATSPTSTVSATPSVHESAPPTTTTTTTAPTTAAAAAAGEQCGSAQSTIGTTLPVIVRTGAVDCEEADRVARDYFTGSDRAQGQQRGLQVGSWFCAVNAIDGRPRATSPFICANGANQFQIGQ